MTRKLLIITGIAILALLVVFPPLRWAGNWEPGGANHRRDRIVFGYGLSHEWVGDIGIEYGITERSIESQTCSSARRVIDWLWLIPEATIGVLLIAVAIRRRSSARGGAQAMNHDPVIKP